MLRDYCVPWRQSTLRIGMAIPAWVLVYYSLKFVIKQLDSYQVKPVLWWTIFSIFTLVFVYFQIWVNKMADRIYYQRLAKDENA